MFGITVAGNGTDTILDVYERWGLLVYRHFHRGPEFALANVHALQSNSTYSVVNNHVFGFG